MKKTQQIIWVGLFTILIAGCKESTPEIPVKNTRYCLDDNFKQKLEFEEATMQPVTEGVHLTGSIETNPDKVVHFVSLVGGIVSKTYFSLGDRVRQGQILAELRSTELSSLEAELKNLETQLEIGEKRLQTIRSMVEDGISTEKELIEAQGDLAILKTERHKVMSNLNLYSASAEKGVFQIKAPSSGIVTAKSIASGTQISAEGEPLFTISDLSEVWVMLDIYATNVQHMEKGMDVNISTLFYPDTVFAGKVGAISQVLDNEAKVLKARVVLRNSDLKLKPGMLVDVIALKDKNIEAISIPTHSMVFDDNQNFVVVYKGDCDMEIRKVDILTMSNGTTFISGGLSEYEKVISKNQLLIYEQINN